MLRFILDALTALNLLPRVREKPAPDYALLQQRAKRVVLDALRVWQELPAGPEADAAWHDYEAALLRERMVYLAAREAAKAAQRGHAS